MFKSFRSTLLATCIAASGLVGCSAVNSAPEAFQPLTVDTFNPGEASIFPVTSSLISGESEILLVDAQFQRNDAQVLVDKIHASGKQLTAVYISHYDPDFYFGLDLIADNFPEAKFYATATTAKKIKATAQPKLDYWGPILEQNAPQRLVMPETFSGNTLMVDGQKVEIAGLDSHDPTHTVLWIPSIKTVTGGVVLYENVHVWMADNQTPASRQSWLKTLDNIVALQPDTIIPGHVVGESAMNMTAVEHTRRYIRHFEQQMALASDSADLVQRMKTIYPNFTNIGDLELSAKVAMGEMKWPM
ncbi:MAG: MBL fold metallo-hydrolase [Marinobacterium sp.]|nr:MBL fold metallo-hydrolase [Marinobacterium sp.]